MTAKKPLRYVVGHTDRIGHRKLTEFEERMDGTGWGAKHFDTWQEARAFVVQRACAELRKARREVKNAERRLQRAMTMKAPTGRALSTGEPK